MLKACKPRKALSLSLTAQCKPFKQVVCFRAALENPGLQKDWKEFAEVMTGKRFQWHPSHETCGVVIWPAVGGNQKNALANEKRKDYARVDVIGYRAVPGEINNCNSTI